MVQLSERERSPQPEQPFRPPSPEEHTYINAELQIKRENLEAYLLKAVMSCETKIEFEVRGFWLSL